MRPILSAQGTYNYALAKWLDEKLKPLSLNQYTISDIFSFSEDLRNTSLNESDILVSHYVSSLFTNVPLDETIHILVEKAFKNNWFNVTHSQTEYQQVRSGHWIIASGNKESAVSVWWKAIRTGWWCCNEFTP